MKKKGLLNMHHISVCDECCFSPLLISIYIYLCVCVWGCVSMCVVLLFQLHLSCWGLLLVAIIGVFVCMCVSGWSRPVSLLLMVLYWFALAVPEGRR